MSDITCPIIQNGPSKDNETADFMWAITAAYMIMISFAYIPIMIMIYS